MTPDLTLTDKPRFRCKSCGDVIPYATADPDDDLLCWPCQDGLDEH